MVIEQKKKLMQAINFFEKGNIKKSKDLLQEILRISPSNFDANHLMGVLLAIERDTSDSIKYFEKAIEINKHNNLVHYNLANALANSGDNLRANIHYDMATRIEPNHAESWLNYGKNMQILGHIDIAIDCCDKAIKIRTNYIEAYINKGVYFNQLKRYEEALINYEQAIKINPNSVEALVNIGVLLTDMAQYEKALESFNKAIQIEENNPSAWSNKGILLHLTKQYNEALTLFERAIQIDENYFDAWFNKAGALNALGRYTEAIESSNKAILINPSFSKAYIERAASFEAIKEFNKSLHDLDKALSLNNNDANARLNRSLINLSNMRFEEGWREYGARLQVSEFSKPFKSTQPIWNGQPGRVLIWQEQGLGDVILYASLFKKLQLTQNQYVILIDARIINLFKRSFPKFEFRIRDEVICESTYDYQLPLCSLGILFWKKIESFENNNAEAYLKDDPEISNNIRLKLKQVKPLICGISWASFNDKIGKFKSIELSDMREIIELTNCSFVNLQYGESKDEIVESGFQNKIISFKELDLTNDIDSLASLIKACDIILTVSNTTAHLAGALGVNTLLMLPFQKGKMWYWIEKRGSSIIYPNTKILNQKSLNSWSEVISKAKNELADTISKSSHLTLS